MKVRQVHTLLEVLQVAKPLPAPSVVRPTDGPCAEDICMEIEEYRLKRSRDGKPYYEIIS